MGHENGVLIVGGYGHVGGKIARRIIVDGGRFVRIAGRDAMRAREFASRIGAQGVAVDVDDDATWGDALDGISTVVVCIDLSDSRFPHEVLRRGLCYVDISATDSVLRGIEDMDGVAREHGGCAVLSVGLAPGLTNLMACAVDAHDVEIAVLLGTGDEHGAAAVDWTLNALRPDVVTDVRAGSPARNFAAIPFDFADQHVLARRSGISARTRLGFTSGFVTAGVLRMMAAMAHRRWFRALVKWGAAHLRIGSDRTMLVIEGQGHRLTLEGRGEADITALVTAQVVRLLSSQRRCGVWHIHELWTLNDFETPLAANGVIIRAV